MPSFLAVGEGRERPLLGAFLGPAKDSWYGAAYEVYMVDDENLPGETVECLGAIRSRLRPGLWRDDQGNNCYVLGPVLVARDLFGFVLCIAEDRDKGGLVAAIRSLNEFLSVAGRTRFRFVGG